ncbi:MAG: FAD-binding protein [Candidatus Omnitrophica bacterium]|nr:FAD-binding protein [Candidatus Omnitrophota bacterium]
MSEMLTTDVVIVGAGAAGLRAAVEARTKGINVLVVSKFPKDGISCSVRAGGELTYSTKRTEAELFRQVVETGGYLSNQSLVEVFVKEVPERIKELADFGIETEFWGDTSNDTLGIIRVSTKGPNSGYGLVRPLRQVAESKGVVFLDNTMVVELLTADKEVIGCVAINLDNAQLLPISAKSVVLATGGGAGIYEHTDNPPGTTGDGIALALQAGAEIVDIECVNFQFPQDKVQSLLSLKEVPDESMLKVGAGHYFL